ncbi:MAG: VOC family protein [Candidatus Rokuibacteriota bacterium]
MPQTAKAVPEGYHTVTPLLVVQDAAKAIEFYKKGLRRDEGHAFRRPGGRIMHAEIKIGDSNLMMSDEAPETGCLSPISLKASPPVGLYLYVQNVDGVFDRAVQAGAW